MPPCYYRENKFGVSLCSRNYCQAKASFSLFLVLFFWDVVVFIRMGNMHEQSMVFSLWHAVGVGSMCVGEEILMPS